MESCFRCGRTEKEVKLFDAIHGTEHVRSCEKCAIIEGIPLLKKPSTKQLKEAERANSVYNRLKTLAGMKTRDEQVENFMERLEKVDETPEVSEDDKPLNLIDNFHWHIQRARRNKGLSAKQLSWALGESESAINMIEKAEIPEDAEKLIRKLEQFFQIKLRERTEQEKQKEQEKKERLKEKSKIPDIEQEEVPIKPIINEPEIKDGDIISVTNGKDINEQELDYEKFPEQQSEEQEKQPSQVLTFKPKEMENLKIEDLKKLKQEQEREDNLMETEKQRKDSLIQSHAQKLLEQADEEEQRKEIAKRKVVEEMKSQALGQGYESIKDKKDILNKKLKEISEKKRQEKGVEEFKPAEVKGKVPSIAELMENKKQDILSQGMEGQKEKRSLGEESVDMGEKSGKDDNHGNY